MLAQGEGREVGEFQTVRGQSTEQAQRLARLAAERRGRVRVAGGWRPEDIIEAVAKWILRNPGLQKELRYDATTSVMAETLLRGFHPGDQDPAPEPSSSSTRNPPGSQAPEAAGHTHA